VLVDVVDALYPPVIMLEWADPWMQARAGAASMAACLFTAHLRVRCVGSRNEPGPGIRAIEQLVTHVLARMRADAYSWSLESFAAPRAFVIGQVTYLAGDVLYAVPTTT
jgi:hypothetical protein